MSTPITRRAVSSGIAWSVPAVAAATAAPAFAASPTPPDIYFECPTTYESIFSSIDGVPNLGAAAVQTAYDPNGILKRVHMDGTTFSMNFPMATVNPVQLYNAKGEKVKTSSGLYLVPGCHGVDPKNPGVPVPITTCKPDVPNGYTLPRDGVVLYDGYGARHSGRVVAATPIGCSPSTNKMQALAWTIETDIYYIGSVCKPIVGPENLVRQMSIPVSLLYVDGLNVVNSKSGGSCCLYLNLYFNPTTTTCAGGQPTLGRAQFTGWDFTAGPPAAPTTLLTTTPHIDVVKTPAGANTKQYTPSDNVRILVGGGFTGTTSVTWGGQRALSFTVLNDNQIEVALPTQEMSNGIFRDIVVTNASGSSPVGSTNVAVARYAG